VSLARRFQPTFSHGIRAGDQLRFCTATASRAAAALPLGDVFAVKDVLLLQFLNGFVGPSSTLRIACANCLGGFQTACFQKSVKAGTRRLI